MKGVLKVLVAGMLVLGGCATAGPQTRYDSLRTQVVRQDWPSDYPNGAVLQTPHYRIHTTVSNPAVLKMLPGFLEQAHGQYVAFTGISPRGQRVGDVYLMADRQQWAAVTRKVVRDRPNSYMSIEAGGYCYRGVSVFWDIGYARTLPVAAHEGLHQFFMFHLRDALPMWLEEGLCVMMESYRVDATGNVAFDPDRRDAHADELRTALRQHWRPLRQLLSMDAGEAIAGTNQEAVSYYAQLWALAHYLRSRPEYRAGLERMLADAQAGRVKKELGVGFFEGFSLMSDGRRYNQALSERFFRHYITTDLDGFERAYTQHARRLAE